MGEDLLVKGGEDGMDQFPSLFITNVGGETTEVVDELGKGGGGGSRGGGRGGRRTRRKEVKTSPVIPLYSSLSIDIGSKLVQHHYYYSSSYHYHYCYHDNNSSFSSSSSPADPMNGLCVPPGG